MKYVIVVGDGMADFPVPELDGRTPLQVADHPNMDEIASTGVHGTLLTVPKGIEANTDVAVLSILGYNPKKCYTGRGPLEAASMGIKLRSDDIALRCNLITQENGMLQDFTAGHIRSEEASRLMGALNEHLGSPKVRFHSGVDYRHLLILNGPEFSDKVNCLTPHYSVGKRIDELKATPLSEEGTETAKLLNILTVKSKEVLTRHSVNLKRAKLGGKPANMIWPWSPGRKPVLRPIEAEYGVRGAIISAVDVVNGIGICAGFDVVKVPGATGYFDTDYEAKAKYAVESMKDHDLVFVHAEAPDEAGHMGDVKLKIKAIEDLDNRLLGNIMDKARCDFTVAVLADHMTPLTVRNHTADPVPFAICSTLDEKRRKTKRFDEECAEKGTKIGRGYSFLPFFLKYGSG